MAVAGDGLARRQNLYAKGLVPDDWPAIRQTRGFDPARAFDEPGIRAAVQELHDRALFIPGGRFCALCCADLSDPGVPLQSSTPTAIKASTGVYPTWTSAIPRGGHSPDCAVPYLLRWLGYEGVVIRMRTHDVDDEQAKVLTAAKEPMELVGADPATLSEAERAARAEVLRGYGLSEEQLQEK